MSSRELRAPFPWFGGKSRAAHLVWPRFGDVRTYVEPFYGSGAILLAREVELYRRSTAGKSMTLRRFYRVADAQNCFNDRVIGKYEGAEFKCWVYRNGKVEVVDLTAKRLLY